MGDRMFVLKRLLLLEDNLNDAELNIREVQRGGYQPEIKITSTEADFVAHLKHFEPDMVLADYNLPGYSGMLALEYTHAHYPELPFIFVTGSLDEETAVECMKKGAWDYVLKTNLIRLKPAIENAIKLKSEQLKTVESSKIIIREEQKFRQIVEQLNETIIIISPRGIVEYISPAVRFAGYTPKEFIGHNICDFCPTEDIGAIKNEFKKLLISDLSLVKELKIKHKGGNSFWIKATAKKITDPEGNINILITTSNIDRQKRTFEALNENEKMFRKMTENISDGLIISEHGHVKFFNDRICQIFGCFPSEVGDLDMVDLAEPEDKIRLKKIFAEEKNTGFGPGELEFWIRRKDGIRRFIHNRYSYTRENGQIVSRYIFVSDLTEKKLSDETIRIYYNQIHTLIQAIPDLIYIKDELGRYILFNKAFERFHGLSAENILHKSDLDITNPDLAEEYKQDDLKAINSRHSVRSEILSKSPDGKKVIFDTIKIPIFDEQNKFTSLIGISRDITAIKESQQKLKSSHKIYQQAIQNAHGIPYLLNYATQKYEFIGQMCEDVIGIPASEMTVKKIKALVKQVELAIPGGVQTEKEADNLFRKGKIDCYIANLKIVTPQGKVKWLHDSAVPYKDSTGKITGSLGILQDITEQKHNEAVRHVLYKIANAVNETADLTELILFIRQALNEVVDTTNFFVALYDKETDSLNLPYFVDEMDHFNHFPAGKTLTGHIIKTNRPMLLRQNDIQKMIDAGLIDQIGTLSKVWLGVPITIAKEVLGAVVVQNYSDENALTENDLNVLKFVSEQIGLSIDRKQAEVTLRNSEDRFRSIFEGSPIGLALYDTTGHYIEANSEFFKILGVEDISWFPEINLFDPRAIFKDAKQILFDGKPVKFEKLLNFDEWIYPHVKSGLLYIDIYVSPIHTGESVLSYLVQIMDVSDRKKVETELLKNEKLESIGILAGGIAHDFNNILTAILGNITLAGMFAAGQEKIKGRLAEAEKATIRARELTQRLLTFSKGGLPVKKICNINTLVEESAKLALAGSKAKCEVQTSKDLRTAEIDEGQISQVLNNIIINADQAMPEGGFIDIYTENYTQADHSDQTFPVGDYVKITITDHGVGIPADYLTKIFDPYFTTKKRGSGLGLTTAYSIIKNHRGKIEVASTVGEGTTFTIYLPATQSAAQNAVISETEEQVHGEGRILVMDDDQIVQEVVSEMLQSLGYESDCVSDGAAALTQYQKALSSNKPYTIVIMDLTIPGGMGGREAVKKLLEIDPKAKVIVSSGYSNDPVMSAFREYGFKGVAAKPYDINELGKVLKEVSRGH